MVSELQKLISSHSPFGDQVLQDLSRQLSDLRVSDTDKQLLDSLQNPNFSIGNLSKPQLELLAKITQERLEIQYIET